MIQNLVKKLKKSILALKKNSFEYFFGLKKLFLDLPRKSKNFIIKKKEQVINLPSTVKHKFNSIKSIRPKDILKFFLNNAILFSLVILIIALIGIRPDILSTASASNVISASSTKLIIALGAGTILVGRGTDLSAGRVVGITAMIAATFSQDILNKSAYQPGLLGHNPFLIIFISIMIGAVIGIINGLIVTKLNVPPFIATLGTMLIVFGLNIFYASKVSNGQSIGSFDEKYLDFASKGFNFLGLNISWTVLISIGVAFIMWIVWNKMSIGKKIFAVGGNEKAALVSGISVSGTIIFTYILGGALYGLGGTLETWKSGSANVSTGLMYELDAIAACIVGGLSFTGGKGKIGGIVLGVLIFQTISYGFSYLGYGSASTYIVKGVIIVAAVALDMIKNRNQR